MKKILLALFLFANVAAFAQNEPEGWEFTSKERSGYYGIGMDRAKELLKKRKSRDVIVAVIDTGLDTEHPDLKEFLWTNKKEIAGNGIDDDGNGYVDDIHGWNYLGSNDSFMFEADNEFLRLKDKYLDKKRVDIKSEDLAEYDYFETKVKAQSDIWFYLSNVYEGANRIKYYDELNEILRTENTVDFLRFKDHFQDSKGRKDFWNTVEANSRANNTTWEKIYATKATKYNREKNKYDTFMSTLKNGRVQIGDNMLDFSDKGYGNSNLITVNRDHGTHVAGTISMFNKYLNGGSIKIMGLRIIPKDGDENDKDVALAIRYAVDHGAQIINMSFGKYFSPNAKEVQEAIKYADSKGIMMFKGAGNNFTNTDKEPFYPTANYSSTESSPNFVVVGAMQGDGNTTLFSCYGKNSVDIFAPGMRIYSTVDNGKYAFMNGTSMATPVTAGAAAFIKAYFPKMKSEDIVKVLKESVNRGEDLNVTVPYRGIDFSRKNIKTSYSELSIAGGFLDIHKAISLIIR